MSAEADLTALLAEYDTLAEALPTAADLRDARVTLDRMRAVVYQFVLAYGADACFAIEIAAFRRSAADLRTWREAYAANPVMLARIDHLLKQVESHNA